MQKEDKKTVHRMDAEQLSDIWNITVIQLERFLLCQSGRFIKSPKSVTVGN